MAFFSRIHAFKLSISLYKLEQNIYSAIISELFQ